jgi:hypothetical protein
MVDFCNSHQNQGKAFFLPTNYARARSFPRPAFEQPMPANPRRYTQGYCGWLAIVTRLDTAAEPAG